ncbi:MAG: gliding motility-associated ABC transporter permease subunit GldF [Bacteroidota bacterium]
MRAIFKKEILSFFTSPVAYLVLGLFFLLNGLFLWVFKGPFNILDFGFADLGNFFLLTPWVLLFLIPAITMKSFSEERKMGTLELLLIKPITPWKLVLGKFLGTFALVALALLPTLIYVYTVSQLGVEKGNLDMGLVYGSYFGLLFLTLAFVSIGLFSSVLTQNTIISFILAIALCFFAYYGLEAIASVFPSSELQWFIRQLGLKEHYEIMARGILDTRDLVYLLGIGLLFLALTTLQLKTLSE